MTPSFSDLIHPVIAYALDLKDRLDRGEPLDLEAEQRQLVDRLRSDGEVRRQADYFGDGAVFLGARYALACWIDELFIVHSSWGDRWKERILEVALYGTRDRAWKFWEQLDVVLRRPGSARPPVPPGADALETFYLCVVLGFRGRYLNEPARVREYVEELRPQVARTAPWPMPRDTEVRTNVEPLTGRDALRRVVAVHGSLALLATLGLLVLAQFLLGG